MAAPTTRMALVPLGRRSGDFSNIHYKIENGLITIQAGELPTPGRSALTSSERKSAMRLIYADRRVVRSAPATRGADSRSRRASGSTQHSKLVVCFRQCGAHRFLLQLVTGILLALIYVPSASEAWNSLQVLNHDITLGWFIRAMHGWGSNFMVAIVLIHMVQVFLFGAYKFPRELTWIVGVFLLLMTLGMAFTGQVLRFDQDAYWGLGIGASIASRVPIVGPAIVKLDARRADHRRRHAFAVLRAARICDSGNADRHSCALHLLMVLKLGINEWPMPGRLVKRHLHEANITN